METSLHPHNLIKIDKYPNKWYCDNVLLSFSCLRGHKKEFKSRDHAAFKCMDGCNFLICDYCMERTKYKLIRKFVFFDRYFFFFLGSECCHMPNPQQAILMKRL